MAAGKDILEDDEEFVVPEMRYPALRTYAGFLRILGGLVLGLGFGAALVSMFVVTLSADIDDTWARSAASIATLLVGLAVSATVGIPLLASGDLLHVFMNIEENGRVSALNLRDIMREAE